MVIATCSADRTITYFPFPNYQEEHTQEWQCVGWGLPGCVSWGWVSVQQLYRSTYFIGSMAIAIRNGVVGSGTSTLNFMHGDQLGSVTALTNLNGSLVSGSISRYYPFGGYRTTPTTNPGTTDQGYTGHKHNDSIGLIYMNARYYVPSIGRFASADTIVPAPENPQSYNRFTYVLNNPLRFTDPTGHCSEDVQLDVVLLCIRIDNLDDAIGFRDAIATYLWWAERNYINFWEALGFTDAFIGELTEKEIAAALVAAIPGLRESYAAWFAVFLAAGLLNDAGPQNANATLAWFKTYLDRAIGAWQESGREDLFMQITVYDKWLENPSFNIRVRGEYYQNEAGAFTYDTIFNDDHQSEGYGNDFVSLLVDVLVTIQGEIGFDFVKLTYWDAYTYYADGYMEKYSYRQIRWFYQ